MVQSKQRVKLFGQEMNESLAFMYNMLAMALRNIATNIPKRFEGQEKARSAMPLDGTTRFSSSKGGSVQAAAVADFEAIRNSSEMHLITDTIESLCFLTQDLIYGSRGVSRGKAELRFDDRHAFRRDM